MKAGSIIFRFRMLFMAILIVIGFSAPWIGLWGLGSRISLLEWLGLHISRLGLLSFSAATAVVIVSGALVAALGALLRIWGSAWLGHGIVINSNMQAAQLMADGPFRYVRNPLYMGMYLWVAAMSLVMPASGAFFVLIAVALLIGVLIAGEEAFLSASLGESYRTYLATVPRILPRLRTTLSVSGNKPRWKQAVLSEIYPIVVFITIAFLSWTYDEKLMWRALLIGFGLSLLARALMPGLRTETSSPQ
ncbi:MAG: methyltransferase [Terracidiphilus sp.]|jgi:protein-S-isoprenylcysteine O-methyltransferase Ste14